MTSSGVRSGFGLARRVDGGLDRYRAVSTAFMWMPSRRKSGALVRMMSMLCHVGCGCAGLVVRSYLPSIALTLTMCLCAW